LALVGAAAHSGVQAETVYVGAQRQSIATRSSWRAGDCSSSGSAVSCWPLTWLCRNRLGPGSGSLRVRCRRRSSCGCTLQTGRLESKWPWSRPVAPAR